MELRKNHRKIVIAMEIATVHKKCAAEALVNVKNNKKNLT